MEKRGALVVLSLFMIRLVSAQFGFGYGSFSITNFFNTIDPSTLVYGLMFFIFFTFILLALTRMSLFKNHEGKPNSTAAAVVSFSVSALLIYYIYRSGYDVQSLFAGFGFQGSLLSLLMLILAGVIAVWIIIKFKIPGFLIILGSALMLISIFTDLIYENGIAFFLGLLLLIVGIIVGNHKRKRKERWIDPRMFRLESY